MAREARFRWSCRWSLSSHTSLGLGQAGHVRELLGRLAGEQREQRLDRDTGSGADAAQRGRLPLNLVVVAKEADEFPVLVGHLDADEPGQRGPELLGPLVGSREEAL